MDLNDYGVAVAETYGEALQDAVISRLVRDVENGDFSCVYELLDQISRKDKEEFLSEDDLQQLQDQWNIA